jgi:glycopeptide antibiotics resistance protein
MNLEKKGKILLCLYVLSLVWILLFKFSLSWHEIIQQSHDYHRSLNLIPFSEPVIVNGKPLLKEMAYNIIIFVPFGGLLTILLKKNTWYKSLSIIFLFSIVIECLQFIFSLGASDITDVITNAFGGLLGILVYKLLDKYINTKKLDKFLINFGMIIFIILIIGIILLLAMNI